MDYHDLELYTRFEKIIDKSFITIKKIILKDIYGKIFIINENTIIKPKKYYKKNKTSLCCIKNRYDLIISIKYKNYGDASYIPEKTIDYSIRISNKIFNQKNGEYNKKYIKPYKQKTNIYSNKMYTIYSNNVDNTYSKKINNYYKNPLI